MINFNLVLNFVLSLLLTFIAIIVLPYIFIAIAVIINSSVNLFIVNIKKLIKGVKKIWKQ